jgi:small subunit ribosomal protein S8
MSVTDPLADMITRIRNGQASGKTEVKIPSSKLKIAVCQVLKEEGYIEGYSVDGNSEKPELSVILKYYKGRPVIERLQRVSKPGRRVYEARNNLPVVLGGFGVAIVSTSKGVMTDRAARESGHGGEVLFLVS